MRSKLRLHRMKLGSPLLLVLSSFLSLSAWAEDAPAMDFTALKNSILSSLTPKKALGVQGSFQTGYSSNVLIVPDVFNSAQASSAVLIPSVKAAALLPQDANQLGIVAEVNYIHNVNDAASGYNAFDLSGAVSYQISSLFGNSDLTGVASNHFDSVFIKSYGSSPYILTDRLSFGVKHHIAPMHNLTYLVPFTYEAYPGITTTNPIDSRKGPTFGLAVSHLHALDVLSLDEGIEAAYHGATGDNFKYSKFSLNFGVNHHLGIHWTNSIHVSPTYTHYGSSVYN